MSDQEKKLLVVEDDQGLQSQLRWSFEGFEVHVAEDRESALTLLRRIEPAVAQVLGTMEARGGVLQTESAFSVAARPATEDSGEREEH